METIILGLFRLWTVFVLKTISWPRKTNYFKRDQISMDHGPQDQPLWVQTRKTWPCPLLESPEARYVAICMLAGSEAQDVTFGLARRFSLLRHAPPHHIQWVSKIWTEMRRIRPLYYLETEQTVSWLIAGDLLRFGSWELGILVFNGWDISGENLMALERIRMEVMEMDFNAAGVRAWLGKTSMMEGPQDRRYFRAGRRSIVGSTEAEEDEVSVEGTVSEGLSSELQVS